MVMQELRQLITTLPCVEDFMFTGSNQGAYKLNPDFAQEDWYSKSSGPKLIVITDTTNIIVLGFIRFAL